MLNKIMSGQAGFDQRRQEQFSDLFKDGIIDPTKVVRTALQNAASVSGLLLTPQAAIAEMLDEKPATPAMPETIRSGKAAPYLSRCSWPTLS